MLSTHRILCAGAIAAQIVLLASCDRSISPGRVSSPSAPATAPAPVPDFRGVAASDETRAIASWALASGDNGHRAFGIVDKRNAHVYVFEGNGRLIGASWVLIGLAPGDDSEPGIGDKEIADVRPDERTTPAGRFVTVSGRDTNGHPVVWLDYADAVAMHSVVTNVPSERRLERLASPNPADHRISYGCINLPPDFFTAVAQPAFAQRGGVIYVLPDTRPLSDVFPSLRRGLPRPWEVLNSAMAAVAQS